MNINELSGLSYDLGDLNQLAMEIDIICRRKLRDGVMDGVLAGREPEIRQDAMIMLLHGFLFGNLKYMEAARKGDHHAAYCQLEFVTSMALRYCKIRLKRKLISESARHFEISEYTGGTCKHLMDLDLWDLPESVRMQMTQSSLRLGVATGQISEGNARIVDMIIVSQMSVEEIANRYKITRGAVYQRLNRVRQVLPKLIARIEVSS